MERYRHTQIGYLLFVAVGGGLALMLGVFLFVQNILIGWVIVPQYVLLDV
jgi:cytochrome b subunit of formate dehydrogenase